MSMPAVGDVAPEVALPDETGNIHRLSEQKGRWTILYFYPEDDTPGCTTEACEFRDRNDVIHERGDADDPERDLEEREREVEVRHRAVTEEARERGDDDVLTDQMYPTLHGFA